MLYLLDDDPSICDIFERFADVLGLGFMSFTTGSEFLEFCSPDTKGCLVLDIWLPDMMGLDLYDKLCQQGSALSVIVISGQADIPLTVRAIKNGAVDFLEKPFTNSVMLERIRHGIELSEERYGQLRANAEYESRYAKLTSREREIIALLIDGSQNKEIARELSISRRTVEAHRANIKAKLGIRSISEIVKHSFLSTQA
jgi:FixJ family two-component response regulator|tara:strand:+ start:269 stop:865 length:597 start_codon:yes stop_codon:yes gene_type:complete